MHEGRARPGPEFADVGVCVKLVRVSTGGLAKIQGGGVALGSWLEDEHAGGHTVTRPAREMGEGGMGAVGIVGIVRSHLGGTSGDYQAHSRVQCREAAAAFRRPGGLLSRLWFGLGALGPFARDELPKRLGDGHGGTVGSRAGRGCILVGHTFILPRSIRSGERRASNQSRAAAD